MEHNQTWITALYVAPQFRRKGLATQLVNRVKAIRRTPLYLRVSPYKDEPLPEEKLIAFYQKMGFQPVQNMNKVYLRYDNPVKENINYKLPKGFQSSKLGSCMVAIEHITKNWLSKGFTDFFVVEGYVLFSPLDDPDNKASHIWIELSNGKKIDPTIDQFKQWGYSKDQLEYSTNNKKYTPNEYLELCQQFPDDISKWINTHE